MKFNKVSILAIWTLLSLPLLSQSTYEVIQDEVFTPVCSGCHYSGSSFAIQSGLVLTADSSYIELTEELPKNFAALEDGLQRVNTLGGMQGLQQSFIWEKLDASNQSHFYNDHPNYGSLMPLGLPYLTNGQLAFIEAWILEGAPEEGIVADVSLLDDTTRFEPLAFEPPDPPENGFQMHLGPFDVWPAEVHDREFLYFEPIETTEDMFISRFDIIYRPGSHHFILFNYPNGGPTPPTPNVYRDLRDENGNIDFFVAQQLNELFPFYFFVGSQTPYTVFHLPTDVGLRLPAGAGFDLNVHSVNRSDTTALGELYVNLHTVEADDITYIADYDHFGNYDIQLPPGQVTTLERTFFFSEQRHIMQIWSHAHEHMTQFSIYGVGGEHDGELLYWTNDWEHPPMLYLDPPVTFEPGDGVRLSTTWDNWTDDWIYYGPLSSDEMQFMFYIYYTGELTDIEPQAEAVLDYKLSQNYPNPFNPSTAIEFHLPQSQWVTLKVFDLQGREVATLLNGRKGQGNYTISFDATDLSTGMYFYTLETGKGYQATRKMLLLK